MASATIERHAGEAARRDEDALSALGRELMGQQAAVPTSALGRLWRTGRSALGISSLLKKERRGESLDLAGIDQIVGRLGAMKGVAMKVGQMMGYVDQAIPDDIRQRMALLQTASPATPWEVVRATVIRSLGARGESLVAGMDPVPVAVASIGQVHRSCAPDGSELAVKVRHPGIADAIRADFRAAGVGRLFGAMVGTPTVGAVIEEAREAFLEECDFAREAEHQQRIGAIFAHDPDLAVPEVLPHLVGEDVLVTRWRGGRSLDEFLASSPSQAERDRVGGALYRFWVRTLYRDGLFHADPHPGNFAIDDSGRVIVYDFGNVRVFTTELRRGLAQLAREARADDIEGMADAIATLGGRPPRLAEDRERVRRLVRGFFGPLVTPGARSVAPDEGLVARDLLADKKALLRLGLPGRMLFLFRLRFGLYAVLARLGAVLDWSELESAWSSELP